MIIGLSGYPNSGKSTVKRHITSNYVFTGATFAKNLKDMAQHCLGLNDVQVYDQEGKETPFALSIGNNNIMDLFYWLNRTHALPPHTMYHVARLLYDLSYDRSFKKVTPRHILRILGTEICRELVCTTYHIDVVKQQIEGCKKVVFDDARFPNEFDICDYTILVKRKGMTFEEVHESDKLMPDEKYSFVIEAEDSDLNGLYRQINDILCNHILKKKI